MLKLGKIAVTGGISSGKTTVCLFFEEFGAFVASADIIVHQLLSPHTEAGKKVVALLGMDIVVESKLSREKIAQKVFGDHSLLKNLETIIHPEVQREIEKLYEEISHLNHSYTLFVVEVPLLFEGKLESHYDYTIAVVADEKICEQRYMQSEHASKNMFRARSKRQLSMQQKARRADFVIENNGDLEELRSEVKQLHDQLVKQFNRK